MGATDSHDQLIADPVADQAADPPPVIVGNERRMHVRAYNFWVWMLAGRSFPAVADLDPSSQGDFGPNSVLVDFRDAGAPRIVWLGRALRDEGAIDDEVRIIAEVPRGSLLARLDDHYAQVIANRAPLGFEAEFADARGQHLMYRGILLPFSSDERTIDHIYGVINWKECADPALTASIIADADCAMIAARAQVASAPAYADGPSRSFATLARGISADPVDLAALAGDPDELLVESLADARGAAESARRADARADAALQTALARAYALACAAEETPQAFAALAADYAVRTRNRSAMRAVVRLAFGNDLDAACVADYAAVLSHARRCGTAPDAMLDFLEQAPGGLRGLVAAERAARRGC